MARPPRFYRRAFAGLDLHPQHRREAQLGRAPKFRKFGRSAHGIAYVHIWVSLRIGAPLHFAGPRAWPGEGCRYPRRQMAHAASALPSLWRVAVTRDEPPTGPLHHALRGQGFAPVSCVVTEEHRCVDPAALKKASAALHDYDWVICASARAVRALIRERSTPWPRGLRTAAVGESTAQALVEAGADPAPIVASDSGAQALCARLLTLDAWSGRRVLVPTVAGGRRDVVEGLSAAGAHVEEIEAYRMLVRKAWKIRAAWSRGIPEAVVIASPSVVNALVGALGVSALLHLKAVVAIGATTARALAAHGVPAETPSGARFEQAARRLAELRGPA